MTALTKPVRRTVKAIERRGLVVTLYPNLTIGLRPTRTRQEYVLPLETVYHLAVNAEMKRQRQAKRTQRLVTRGLLRRFSMRA